MRLSWEVQTHQIFPDPAFSAGNLSGHLASGLRGGLELSCLSAVFLFQLLPTSAVHKKIKESSSEREQGCSWSCAEAAAW